MAVRAGRCAVCAGWLSLVTEPMVQASGAALEHVAVMLTWVGTYLCGTCSRGSRWREARRVYSWDASQLRGTMGCARPVREKAMREPHNERERLDC